VTPDAMAFLEDYDWPGNIRELENAIERAVVLSKGRTLHVDAFSFLRPQEARSVGPRTLREMEKDYIHEILTREGWNISHSAKILGINRVTLHKMIKRYNLQKTP
jgi:transcriptional regulator of acetoin/glycerol metabolism